MRTSVSRLPAGTFNSAPFICMSGSAEPQVEQKQCLCRVFGRLKTVTRSCPDSHFNDAVDENKLAA